MKQCIASLLIGILLLTALSSMGCAGSPPPVLDDVYDELVTLLEEAHEVNVLMYGAGLPTYPQGDAEDQLIHRYYGVSDNSRLYVTPYAKFGTVTDMREAIESVYSEEYRASIMETLFTGYADTGLSVLLPARYTEDEEALYQSAYVDPLVTGVRFYDYASMVILPRSTATQLRVSIRSYTDKTTDVWQELTLSFVYENGAWYLDGPSC